MLSVDPEETFQNIQRIINQTRGTKFVVKFISVDGDKKYENKFEESLSSCMHLINELLNNKKLNINAFVRNFESSLLVLYISGTLHLFKNFRSRLIKGFNVINLLHIGQNAISADEIEKFCILVMLWLTKEVSPS